MPSPTEHYERAEALLEQAAAARQLVADALLTGQDVGPEQAAAAVSIAGAEPAASVGELQALAGVHATLACVPWAVERRGDDELAAELTGDQVCALIAVLDQLDAWSRSGGSVPGLEAMDHAEAEGYVIGFDAARDAVAKVVGPVAVRLAR